MPRALSTCRIILGMEEMAGETVSKNSLRFPASVATLSSLSNAIENGMMQPPPWDCTCTGCYKEYEEKRITYPSSNFTEPFVLFGNKIRLADVDEVYHRFGGDQRKLLIDDFNLENVNVLARNKKRQKAAGWMHLGS
jgi:hypothetical protein